MNSMLHNKYAHANDIHSTEIICNERDWIVKTKNRCIQVAHVSTIEMEV